MQLLLDANFHRSESWGAGEGPNGPPHRPTARSWEVAKDVVKPGMVAWAIDTFGPFKSLGTDGIFSALLQKVKDLLIGPLVRVFRTSIACKYIQLEWRTAKVVFIRKAGRVQHIIVKDFRPISLTSFVLKTLEKVVDRYLRDRIPQTSPLHTNQHAYRTGYSTESALHAAVAKIEARLEKGGYAVGIFMDIEGAFNHTPPEVACREALDRGIASPLVDWMDELLRNR
uniref:Reverse transcriptase domain-containing protein n=1 Tax=Trichogramma kaykai TaxID=54128 RepID=A0ABD2W1R6_9HYME